MGKENYNKIEYKSKNDNAQEAHEAIRPVKIENETVEKNGKINEDEIKMYNLIWKRTVASQMVNAELNVYNIYISISKNKKYKFFTKLEEVTKMGFFLIMTHKIPEVKITKETFKKNKKVILCDVAGTETYKNPPLRYTEAGLVKKMESLSIGRPATYAQTISTIQEKYVCIKDIEGIEKEIRTIKWSNKKEAKEEIKEEIKKINIGKEKNKFSPTDLGIKVNNLMLKYFPDIMKYDFTAEMEKELDNIMEGKTKLNACLTKFWNKLEPLLNSINIDDENLKVKNIIGIHPETKQEITASISQYGNYLKMGDFKAPIKKPLTIETITLEQAIKILEYPKILGTNNKCDVLIKKGAFGYYLEWNKIKVSIKEEELETINLEKAISILEEKKESNINKEKSYLFFNKTGNIEYSVRENEKKDKYIMVRNSKKPKDKPMFMKYPTDIDIKTITVEKIKELIKQQKPKKTYIKKTQT